MTPRTVSYFLFLQKETSGRIRTKNISILSPGSYVQPSLFTLSLKNIRIKVRAVLNLKLVQCLVNLKVGEDLKLSPCWVVKFKIAKKLNDCLAGRHILKWRIVC